MSEFSDGLADLVSLEHATDSDFGIQLPGGGILKTHGPAQCSGEWCVIHRPSPHHMRDWKLNWRGDRGLMERLCPHGIGHPDPDDLAHKARTGSNDDGTHGCDGCCAVLKEES